MTRLPLLRYITTVTTIRIQGTALTDIFKHGPDPILSKFLEWLQIADPVHLTLYFTPEYIGKLQVVQLAVMNVVIDSILYHFFIDSYQEISQRHTPVCLPVLLIYHTSRQGLYGPRHLVSYLVKIRRGGGIS